MEVTYHLTPEALDRLNRYMEQHHQRVGRYMAMLLLAVIVGLALGLIFIQQFSTQRPGRTDAYAQLQPWLILIIISGVFSWSIWSSRKQKRALKTHPAFTEPHTTRLTPQHLYNQDATGESFTNWHSLHDIGEDEEYIYFFTTKTTAFIIPKQAFAAPTVAQEFSALARTYRQHAKSSGAG